LDWNAMFDLLRTVGGLTPVFFITYIVFFDFAFFNIVTSMFVGFLSSICMIFLMTSTCSDEQMNAFGWRIPFMLSIIPGVVAIWGMAQDA